MRTKPLNKAQKVNVFAIVPKCFVIYGLLDAVNLKKIYSTVTHVNDISLRMY